MPSTRSLIKTLRHDYPKFTIKEADDFHWSFEDNVVTYADAGDATIAHLLHELSHALLDHRQYDRDIELLGLERDAWAYAKDTLAPQYALLIPDDVIKQSLDSYRDWLHARSTCPNCNATGIEIKKAHYECPACTKQWKVNEARLCALRRYGI